MPVPPRHTPLVDADGRRLVTLDELALAAGVSPRTLSRYFVVDGPVAPVGRLPGRGRPLVWVWEDARPWLLEEYGRALLAG